MRDINRRSWFSALAGGVAAALRAANPPSSSLGGPSEARRGEAIGHPRRGITVPADGKVRTFTLS
jgi:hypothetical protein